MDKENDEKSLIPQYEIIEDKDGFSRIVEKKKKDDREQLSSIVMRGSYFVNVRGVLYDPPRLVYEGMKPIDFNLSSQIIGACSERLCKTLNRIYARGYFNEEIDALDVEMQISKKGLFHRKKINLRDLINKDEIEKIKNKDSKEPKIFIEDNKIIFSYELEALNVLKNFYKNC